MHNETKVTPQQQPDKEQEGKKELVSRRKVLASLGMAGVALASSGLVGGALSTAYADPAERRKKVKDLMVENLLVYTTIAELRTLSNQDTESLYYVTDTGQEGMFRFNSANTVSADNGGTILVSASGARFERIFDGMVNVKWFGAKGGGSHDDTIAIQKAIDAKQGTVFLPKGRYLTSAPIVVQTGDSLVGEGPEVTIIEKTTVTAASLGTRTMWSAVDNYNVDAVIIALAPNDDYVRYLHIEGIMAKRGATPTTLPKNASYCFYAPRIYFLTQKNVEYRHADTGYYTANAWMVTLERVSSRWVTKGFVCGDYDAQGGGGTSHTVTSCWAGACEKWAWKINVSYSNFIACGADYIGYNPDNPPEYVYQLRGVALTLTGCGTEEARGTLLSVYDMPAMGLASSVNVVGFMTYNYYGDRTAPGSYVISVKNNSMLTLTGGDLKVVSNANAKFAEVANSSKLLINGLTSNLDYMDDSEIVCTNLGEASISGAKMKSLTHGQEQRDSYSTNGSINIVGAWDKALLKFTDSTSRQASHLWVDASGSLRIKKGAEPASDSDGQVVGEQNVRRGTSTQSASGSQSQFLIAHGLGSTPSYYNVTPASSLASGIQYIEADQTNIIIYYSAAPSVMSNGLMWKWEARL
ncbi:glycosyl hydrolase family 28-related protein [Paenibacillus sp. MBLB4367]|uniref:glycosyl hydrolase family 28-related protein n=1 Tax=Paenibacillus sp. MBLB4367 TaxID=3384767 RepID=UPI003908432D